MLNLIDGEEIISKPPENTRNVYHFWDIRAPEGFVISMLLEQIEIDSAWDEKAFLFYGDNTSHFQGNMNSCNTWISLTNKEGLIENRYKNFFSRSSLVKLIFSSLSTPMNFIVKIRAVKFQGNQK